MEHIPSKKETTIDCQSRLFTRATCTAFTSGSTVPVQETTTNSTVPVQETPAQATGITVPNQQTNPAQATGSTVPSQHTTSAQAPASTVPNKQTTPALVPGSNVSVHPSSFLMGNVVPGHSDLLQWTFPANFCQSILEGRSGSNASTFTALYFGHYTIIENYHYQCTAAF